MFHFQTSTSNVPMIFFQPLYFKNYSCEVEAEELRSYHYVFSVIKYSRMELGPLFFRHGGLDGGPNSIREYFMTEKT